MRSSYGALLRAARAFYGDFARFAGARGLGVLALVAVGALCEGVGLTLLVPILGLAVGGTPQGWPTRLAEHAFAVAGLANPDARLAVLLAGFLVLLALRGLVMRARDIGQTQLQTGFVERQRRDVIGALAHARWEVIEHLRHGRVAQAIGGDVLRVAAVSNFAIQATMAAVAVAVQMALAFALSPPLTLAAGAFALVSAATLAPWLRRVFVVGGALVHLHGQVMETMRQFLGGMKLAVSQNLQGGYVAQVEASLAQLREQQIDLTRRQAKRRLAGSIIAGLVGVLIVFVGLRVLHTQPLVLLAVLALLARAVGPATQIGQSAQAFVQALPAYAQVRSLCDELADSQPAPAANDGIVAVPPRAALAFRKLTYVRDREPVLKDVDLALGPGAFVGLTGESGAGKSTLADLLVGLLTPTAGDVLVAGQPLTGDRLPAWRDRLAYVSQDPFLFHDTIRANLTWGAADDTEEADLWWALALTGAEALVRGLPRGLDTVVGERGTLVSGGERQRLALARALLRRPDLMILDEATNAIDVDSEALILSGLRTLEPRPTILLIAHRRESFQACDTVMQLEAGRLRPQAAWIPARA